MINNNAEINKTRSIDGATPLFFAAMHGQKEIVKQLVLEELM